MFYRSEIKTRQSLSMHKANTFTSWDSSFLEQDFDAHSYYYSNSLYKNLRTKKSYMRKRISLFPIYSTSYYGVL